MTDLHGETRRERHRLYTGSLLTIEDHHCRRPVGRIGALDEVDGLEILVPRRGSWVMHVGDDATLVDPNHVALLVPDRGYRNSHPRALTTRSTVIGVSPHGFREVFPSTDKRCPPGRVAAHTVVPRDARFDLLHRRLLQWTAEDGSGLAVEEIGLRLAACLVREGTRPPCAPGRPATERRHRELVEGAKAFLDRRLASTVSLSELARALQVSPFHLSRVFAASTGMPAYRYFLRLRLSAVMERVLDGADITTVAMELGFADHSHLTRQFRRELGIAPSLLRQAPSLVDLRDQVMALEQS